MNLLEFNHIHINYFDKTMSFQEFDASDELFVYAKKVDEFMKDEAGVFMILASMKAKSKALIDKLTVVCDFLKVFPDDISDLSLECEVQFPIDLELDTSHISMAPYRMSTSELSELKKQLEELLEKKFVSPSVSPWEAPTLFA